jgi:hypothetical protein
VITPATIVRRNLALHAAHMGDETIMLSIERGEYYTLDAIGGRLWALMAEPTSVDSLLDAICAEFDVVREIAVRDTFPFLEKLLESRVIEVQGDGADP